MIPAGTWDGRTFKLRTFPSHPGGGSIKNVTYSQTMGKMTLTFVFKGPLADLTAKDLSVELSSWQLKVEAVSQPGLTEKLSAINGDLWGDIRRDLSWWTLGEESGKKVFTIELAKREHKSWDGVWKLGMNPHRKQHFGWNDNMKAPVKKAEDVLVKLRPGSPSRCDNDKFVINREALCIDLEDGQDAHSVTFRIHLEPAALEKACEQVCLADLFGVDVMERHIKVFIRGDEPSPILMGELGGKCIPDKSTWEIIQVRPLEDHNRNTQPQMIKALRVTIAKHRDSHTQWPKLIHENEYALRRDCAPQSLEELARLGRPRTPSPDRSSWSREEHAKENKAKGDAAFKKCDFKDAVIYYTRAINHTPEDEKLYSNRSACYTRLKKFEKALADAQKCISMKQAWPKAYFRQGLALRGLQRWDDARDAFEEGRFRDPHNPEWDREIEKTDTEQSKYEHRCSEERKLRREADLTTELNESTLVAQREAMTKVAEHALKHGKTGKEAGELAVKGAEYAKNQVHEMASRKKAMMVEDDKEPDEPAPYRIVCEDGSVHGKALSHTDKGMYFMGMTVMNYKSEPGLQPWIEIYHPGKLRWSQGCATLKLKISLPASVTAASELDVKVSSSYIRVGTIGNTDPIVEGELEAKVEPDGDNFCWYVIPDEKPPILDICLDKDASQVYQTWSYTSLIWPRLFKDDVLLGEGLFEADLTDIPPHLLEKYQRDQAYQTKKSEDERARRKKMTEEEINEETARNWNDEFARHGIPHRMETEEDKLLKYG